MGRAWGWAALLVGGAVAVLTSHGEAAAQTTAEILERLTAEQGQHYEAYRRAQFVFDKELDVYWDAVDEKRSERRRKRGQGLAFGPQDYVADQPPKYKGPALRADIAKIIADLKPPAEQRELPTVADFLANAKEHYAFVPERTTEAEFKRRYAREALAIGLTKEQVVRVYALETGGRGTFDMQAGIDPDTKAGRPISSALGYAQLLHANSVNELANHGASIVVRLNGLLRTPGLDPRRVQALKAKIAAVRAMVTVVRSVPNDWGAHTRLASTPRGLGVHALNMDADIGPWLQVIKLGGLKEEAEKAGRPTLNGSEIELMNLAGPRTGLEMMEPAGRRAPTANFFSRAGYYRNTIVREKTGAELLKALDERMDVNIVKPGAQEFARIFDEIAGRRSGR